MTRTAEAAYVHRTPVAYAGWFTKRFRRDFGPVATADLALVYTRMQQRPQPEWPTCDLMFAYYAMAYLRSAGRPELAAGRMRRVTGAYQAIVGAAGKIARERRNIPRGLTFWSYAHIYPAAQRRLDAAANCTPWRGWQSYVDAAGVRMLTQGES